MLISVALLCVLAAPTTALSAALKLRVVASAPGTGYPERGTATVTSIRHPGAVYVRVVTDPKVPVTITWTLRCLKNGNHAAKTGNVHGPSGKLIRLALPVAKPSSCYATAQSGEVARSLTVQVLAD